MENATRFRKCVVVPICFLHLSISYFSIVTAVPTRYFILDDNDVTSNLTLTEELLISGASLMFLEILNKTQPLPVEIDGLCEGCLILESDIVSTDDFTDDASQTNDPNDLRVEELLG
nr:PREDICTED: uncharacterized protein LOC109043536 [Bemisia tabaci]